MKALDEHPPYPRLVHCRPGAIVQLFGETQLRTIERIEDGYAYFNGGTLAVSLGHRANQFVKERNDGKWQNTKRQLMHFGNGAGWHVQVIPTDCEQVDGQLEDIDQKAISHAA